MGQTKVFSQNTVLYCGNSSDKAILNRTGRHASETSNKCPEAHSSVDFLRVSSKLMILSGFYTIGDTAYAMDVNFYLFTSMT